MNALILFVIETKPYLQMAVLSLCVIKLFLFVLTRKKSWTLENFFYFDNKQLILSASESSYKNKKVQNDLTIIISLLTCFQILSTVLSYR